MQTTSRNQQDVDQIRSLVADAERHQNDPDRFTQLHAPKAAIVNVAGRRIRGRDVLHESMRQALAGRLAKVLTRTEIIDIDFIRPDVALVHTIKHIFDHTDDDGPTLPTRGAMQLVLTREDGTWQIAAAQTTPIRE